MEESATTPAGTARSRRASILAVAVALVAAACGAIVFLAWRQGAVSRAIEKLPDEERAAEYLRTRQELETVCRDAREPLRAHCQQQALFLSYFPECDAACRELVRRQFPPEPAR